MSVLSSGWYIISCLPCPIGKYTATSGSRPVESSYHTLQSWGNLKQSIQPQPHWEDMQCSSMWKASPEKRFQRTDLIGKYSVFRWSSDWDGSAWDRSELPANRGGVGSGRGWEGGRWCGGVGQPDLLWSLFVPGEQGKISGFALIRLSRAQSGPRLIRLGAGWVSVGRACLAYRWGLNGWRRSHSAPSRLSSQLAELIPLCGIRSSNAG